MDINYSCSEKESYIPLDDCDDVDSGKHQYQGDCVSIKQECMSYTGKNIDRFNADFYVNFGMEEFMGLVGEPLSHVRNEVRSVNLDDESDESVKQDVDEQTRKRRKIRFKKAILSKVILKTQNVVAKFDLETIIDIGKVMRNCPSAELCGPPTKKCAILRFSDPFGIVNVHTAGKCFCHSATSEQDAYEICRRVGSEIRDIGYNICTIQNFHIDHVYSTANFHFKISLLKMKKMILSNRKEGNSDFVSSLRYSKDSGPYSSLKVVISELSTTLRFYHTGAINIFSHSVAEAEEAMKRMYQFVNESRCVSRTRHIEWTVIE